MKKPTRKEACLKLLERALIEPISVPFDSPKSAKAWRYTCYSLRQSLQVAGDRRFDSISMRVNDTNLEIYHADS